MKKKRPMPKRAPESLTRSYRLPKDLWNAADRKAAALGLSGNAYVRTLIENDLNQSGEKK
jgi:predicted HicB family RNase H-like nuclease